MKKSHRKTPISLIALLAMLCVGYANTSYGAPSHRIKLTKHNFSISGPGPIQSATSPNPETEICVFCHTPHNAVAGKKFLWNRTNRSDVVFQMYTASPTLNFSKAHGNEVSSVSKMCLSCHDGAGSINAMANPRPGGIVSMDPAGDQIGDLNNPSMLDVGLWGTNIGQADIDNTETSWPEPTILNAAEGGGGLLVNDHPISFIYKESCDNDISIKKETGTCDKSSIGGLPLWYEFLGTAGGYRVECVTCHDPHINYSDKEGGDPALKPFLRKSNASSSLCFTCHDK